MPQDPVSPQEAHDTLMAGQDMRHHVTMPLDAWLREHDTDGNLFWRTPLGDLQNLMEEAVERMRRAETALRAIQEELR